MFTRVAIGLLLAGTLAVGLLAVLPQPALASGGHGDSGGEAQGGKPGGDTGGLSPIPTTFEEIQGDLAIWTAVIFLVLLLVLGKYAWGPISQGLEKREQGIADQVAQAEQNNQKARELLAQYEQMLANSEEEVRKMIEQGRREADEAGRQIVEKAKGDAAAEHQRALREIEAATADALKELSELSATLAVQLAGRIVGAELKPADHAQLIAKAMADFPKAKAGTNGNT